VKNRKTHRCGGGTEEYQKKRQKRTGRRETEKPVEIEKDEDKEKNSGDGRQQRTKGS
jgi:hypothetical protein